MNHLTANQRKRLAGKIRTGKNKLFPERGGGKKLAAMLGVSLQSLASWMKGTRLPSMMQLAMLARIFNTSMQELCSLPHEKRKAKAPDLIVALTKYHEKANAAGVDADAERKRLQAITIFICKELDDCT